MQFTVAKAELCRAMNLVTRVVEKKTTIPILANVKLVADDGYLTVTGTDMEAALVVTIEAKVTTPGAITLPAKRLADFSRLLATGEVGFKVSESNWVTITAGRSKTRIAGTGAESFPELPTAPDDSLTIPSAIILKVVELVKVAILVGEDSRFTLKGALLEHGDGQLRMIATDSHRLAVACAELAGTEPLSLLVPLRAISNLPSLSPGVEAFEMSQAANHIFFRAGETLLITRKVAGSFPDYKRIMPKSAPIAVTLKRAEFAGALARVAQFADERSRAVRLRFDGGLEIFATSADAGDSTETVPCDYSGSLIEVGFNAQYIAQFLEAVDAEDVTFHLTDAKSAGELRAAGSEQYRYVIMPMRI